MATSIYINTDLKDLTANAVANINRPTQVVRLPQIVEGEVVDVVLHLVKSNGAYDSRSGSGSSVSVAISSRGKAATSGTFTLNAGTATTGALAWNASAEAVEGALNALNSGTGAFGSKVKVTKLGAGSYRVIFDTVGARTDMAGTSIDLGPESEVTAATSVVGTSTIRAQQVIEISQQPAIYTETWTAVGNTWTGQLNANTARVQELIAEGAGAFFEVKIGSDVVCQVPISVLSAVAAPNSLPAHELPGNLDAFAADPSTNGSFNPANWREDLSLNNYAPINNPTFTGTATIPSADITTADFNAAGLGGELSWNDQEKTLDLVTGSDNVTVQIGQEVTLFARNSSGAAMSDGQVVMVDGSQGNKPTIALAQADTVENARKTIGIVTQPIPNNSNGFVTLIGKVRDLVLDSGTFTEGDVVYLSSTVAGGITNVKPNIIVELGHVLATSNGGNTNGVLEVQINNESAVYELEQTLNASIATKAPIASPTLTGDLTVGNIQIGQSSSSTVVNLLDASNGLEARYAIGAVNYPYTTDFQSSGTEQTRNLTSITSSSGYTPNSNLTSIYVGSSVTSIGNDAFYNCTGLTSIIIPDSVINLGFSAFSGCTNLTSITIPNSVTSIGYATFLACTSLTSVTIPNSLTSIGYDAFIGCSSLTSINIPNSVTSIGNGAFAISGLTSINIPDSVTSIGNDAFYNCTNLSTINCFATTAPTLGTNAFINVSAITIQVPVGAAGYGTTYGGLTVSYVL